MDVKIYTSKENVAKLKANKAKFIEQNNYYQSELDEVYQENERLHERINELEDEVYNLKYNTSE